MADTASEESDTQPSNAPPSGWDLLPSYLLDRIKSQIEESDADRDATARKLQALRLVNRHWSNWATGATTYLSPHAGGWAPFGKQIEMLSRTFVNLRSLKPRDGAVIPISEWGGLRKLTNLTELNLRCVNARVTHEAAAVLGALTSLRDLDLTRCPGVTDESVARVTSLPSLTRLSLHECADVTDAGVSLLSGLTSLVDLDIGSCWRITDAGVRHLSRQTALTKLRLFNCSFITSEGVGCLEGLTELRDLDLGHCLGIKDVGVRRLTSLASLTKLSLTHCPKITDEALTCLTVLANLTDVDLRRCKKVTEVGVKGLRDAVRNVRFE